jgi:hypothetical protein
MRKDVREFIRRLARALDHGSAEESATRRSSAGWLYVAIKTPVATPAASYLYC